MGRMGKLLTLVAGTALAVGLALPTPAMATTDETHPTCSGQTVAATPLLMGASCFLTINCPGWVYECWITSQGDVSGIGAVQGAITGNDGPPSTCAGWNACTLPARDTSVSGGTPVIIACAANGIAVFETVNCSANFVYVVI